MLESCDSIIVVRIFDQMYATVTWSGCAPASRVGAEYAKEAS
jgi:hypothetical protein